MKRLVLAGLLIAYAAMAPAQAAGAKISVSQDQRNKISAYVTQQKVKPVTFQARMNRGSKVDNTITLLDVPSEWGTELGKFKYVYSNDNRILFINPTSREVAYAIKVSSR